MLPEGIQSKSLSTLIETEFSTQRIIACHDVVRPTPTTSALNTKRPQNKKRLFIIGPVPTEKH